MNFEHLLTSISTIIWNIFLPILVVIAFLVWPKIIFKIKNLVTEKSTPTLKQAVGPISISLGAMVGTGAIVGVLGAINKLPAGVKPEAIAIWSLVGMLVMLPLIYSEVIVTKVMKKSPKEYISMFISPKAGVLYGFGFMILYVFGFGGFQFSGISDVVNTLTVNYFDFELSSMQLYLMVVMPLFAFSSIIILTKKHELFINVLTVMITTAVGVYIIFLVVFLVRTSDFSLVYLANLKKELLDPTSIAIGLPVGFLFGLQRIIQTSEAGLGGLAMSSLESDSEPRAAAIIAIIPSLITIIIAILGTTYIASYGIEMGIMSEGATSLDGFFKTANAVTGTIGVIVLVIFTVLSGLTTLIGSYYFVDLLMVYTQNQKIALYMVLIFVAGTLAVFGFSIVFDVIDLLMFVVTGLNVVALFIFTRKHWEKYRLENK
ncbi:alanine:cation symporter family protein [Mollicutes bacterium LVI A0039]|nr:alanine:cation symporter family protein [Mollicutes bacterium LVI A0039]